MLDFIFGHHYRRDKDEGGSASEKRFVDMRMTEVQIGEDRQERRRRKERARILREQAPVIDAIVTKVESKVWSFARKWLWVEIGSQGLVTQSISRF
jgi:hypothetical protein